MQGHFFKIKIDARNLFYLKKMKKIKRNKHHTHKSNRKIEKQNNQKKLCQNVKTNQTNIMTNI